MKIIFYIVIFNFYICKYNNLNLYDYGNKYIPSYYNYEFKTRRHLSIGKFIGGMSMSKIEQEKYDRIKRSKKIE